MNCVRHPHPAQLPSHNPKDAVAYSGVAACIFTCMEPKQQCKPCHYGLLWPGLRYAAVHDSTDARL